MRRKILVIDDNTDILEPISLILEDMGYEVKISTQADKACEFVKEFQPNLVILDILMSGIDGRDICKKIKTDESMKTVPVVMMSAHPNTQCTISAYKANGFIGKPFEVDELLNVVERNIV